MVPPGTHEAEIESDRPVTVGGAGTTLRGDDSEPIVTVRADG